MISWDGAALSGLDDAGLRRRGCFRRAFRSRRGRCGGSSIVLDEHVAEGVVGVDPGQALVARKRISSSLNPPAAQLPRQGGTAGEFGIRTGRRRGGGGLLRGLRGGVLERVLAAFAAANFLSPPLTPPAGGDPKMSGSPPAPPPSSVGVSSSFLRRARRCGTPRYPDRGSLPARQPAHGRWSPAQQAPGRPSRRS